MIKDLIKKLRALNFSDLHLSEGKIPTIRNVVWDIQRLNTDKISHKEIREIIIEIAWKDNLKKVEEDTEEVDCAYSMNDIWRCRLNIFKDINWLNVSMRIIPEKILDLKDIGFDEDVIKQITSYPNWLILITWSTWSWKSTSLSSVINFINKNSHKNIITIEDPIEFVYENLQSNIIQREVWQHTKSFWTALKAAMREDPDIILIWEMNDLDTIQSALTLAETWHLVFWTLHTNWASSTINRIIDVFPEGKQNQIKSQLATSLRSIISQALIKRDDWSWRVAAREFLIANTWIQNIIKEWNLKQINSMIQIWKKDWMNTLNASLIKLVKEWVVSAEDALKKTNDKADFMQYFKD